MRIFIDADACPKAIKEILYRAANRTKIPLVLVANRYLQVPISPYIKSVQVSSGIDEADKWIADNIEPKDLLITADIPLADIVVTKGATAINPRGRLYTKENIKHQLTMRNLMEQLRDNKVVSGGPASLDKATCEEFANQLDRILANMLKFT